MVVLGTVYSLRRKYEDARLIYQDVLEEYEKIYGVRHLETRKHLSMFIKMLYMVPDVSTAINMIHKCVLRTIEDCGPLNLESINITEFYGNELIELQQFNDADAIYVKLFHSAEMLLEPMNVKTAELALKIGNFHHHRTNNYDKAMTMYVKSYDIFDEVYGETDQITVDVQNLIKKMKVKLMK